MNGNWLAPPSNSNRLRDRARGVTLVEVLIVVAILALIAGSVAIFAIPRYIDAQKRTAETEANTLRGAVDQWRMTSPERLHQCPTSEMLVADRIVQERKNDPWYHPYRIVCSGWDVSVASDGPDGRPDTEDDIWAGPKPSTR
jgi:general secretion pathway protein G